MLIYKISIDLGFDIYDAYDSHIIVADTEKTVRNLASDISADEGQNVWKTAKIEICGNYTSKETLPFILSSSFNAA